MESVHGLIRKLHKAYQLRVLAVLFHNPQSATVAPKRPCDVRGASIPAPGFLSLFCSHVSPVCAKTSPARRIFVWPQVRVLSLSLKQFATNRAAIHVSRSVARGSAARHVRNTRRRSRGGRNGLGAGRCQLNGITG